MALGFLWDYIMNLSYRLDTKGYIFSLEGFIDLISIIPGCFFFLYGAHIVKIDDMVHVVEILTLLR